MSGRRLAISVLPWQQALALATLLATVGAAETSSGCHAVLNLTELNIFHSWLPQGQCPAAPCVRNNFAYDCALVVMSLLLIRTRSSAPAPPHQHVGCSAIIWKRTCALTCWHRELNKYICCVVRGRFSGVSVPLKGIPFEGAMAGELTFSPALPFSLWDSVAAFNQVPLRCLCSMWCLCNGCPRVQLLSCTPTQIHKHP